MLSAYISPEGINGGVSVSSLITEYVYKENYGALDKRADSSAEGIVNQTVNAINTAKTITDTITNALGVRSPYYVIGEISDAKYGNSLFTETIYGNVIRAVQDITTEKEQDGVIIDCLGDVNATISVEFTKNPVLFQSTTVSDSRMRKPTTLRATVAVSNNLSDDLIGSAAAGISALDPTGTVATLANHLLNSGNTRAQSALYKLRYLMENGKPFTVYTPHGYYENMLITSLAPKTNEGTMDMLLCDITFQEVIMYRPYFDGTSVSKIPARTNVLEATSKTLARKINNLFA